MADLGASLYFFPWDTFFYVLIFLVLSWVDYIVTFRSLKIQKTFSILGYDSCTIKSLKSLKLSASMLDQPIAIISRNLIWRLFTFLTLENVLRPSGRLLYVSQISQWLPLLIFPSRWMSKLFSLKRHCIAVILGSD